MVNFFYPLALKLPPHYNLTLINLKSQSVISIPLAPISSFQENIIIPKASKKPVEEPKVSPKPSILTKPLGLLRGGAV
jgi:hypothetical protein